MRSKNVTQTFYALGGAMYTLQEMIEIAEDKELLSSVEDLEGFHSEMSTLISSGLDEANTEEVMSALERATDALSLVDERMGELAAEQEALASRKAELSAKIGQGNLEETTDTQEDHTEETEFSNNTEEVEPTEEVVEQDAGQTQEQENQKASLAALATLNFKKVQDKKEEPEQEETNILPGFALERTADRMGRTVYTTGVNLEQFAGVMRSRGTSAGAMNQTEAGRQLTGGQRINLGYLIAPDEKAGAIIRPGDDVDGIISQRVTDFTNQQRKAATIRASGGLCGGQQTDYSIGVLSDTRQCFTDSLPSINAPGGIRYRNMITIDNADYSTFGGVVTSDEDAAGYAPGGPTPLKDNCYVIACDDLETCAPQAIYSCVTVGNFMQLSDPDYVRVLNDVANTMWIHRREQEAIKQLELNATPITGGAALFGASVDFLQGIRNFVGSLRATKSLWSTPITVQVPSWLKYVIANDIAASLGFGTDNLGMNAERALAVLGLDENIFISEYCVPGATTPWPNQIAAGPLAPLPSTANIFVYPTGAVLHNKAGVLELGIDQLSYATNDRTVFAESFESVCFRNKELVYNLTLNLCDSGKRGATVDKVCS